MLAPRRRFVWLGPEVRHPGDQAVRELEERHRVTWMAVEKPFEPHHRVTLISDRDLRPQMPVTGILLIEPQVAITPPDPLPRLRDLIHDAGMQQPCPGIPVPGFQGCDEALGQLTV